MLAATARFTPPDLVDLRTAWTRERELAARPGSRHDGVPGPGCEGRHGWLLDEGYDALLEPVLGSNAMAGPGYYPFSGLDGQTAAALLERLPDDYLATERQNLGPTIGAVLRAVARYPHLLRAHGYVIGPLRCDERITVTGVLVRTDRELRLDAWHEDGCECHDLFTMLTDELGVDDMHTPPDEVTPWWGFGLFGPAAPGAEASGANRPGTDGPDADRRGVHGPGADEHWYRLWWD
ncbi:hypothetical protein GCM10009809_16420 [Isoptericola hypogeus]|uniref:Uncharacterized protein n=1 Tax=Isoptericola hypogeus TaxID=300179 RepID=A0ABP4VB97_9MICO